MRSFLAASIILLTTVILLFFCSFALQKETKELQSLCTQTQQNTSPEPGLLARHWERCRFRFSLWLHRAEIHSADEALRLALLCFENGHTEEFAMHLDTFRRCLAEMAESQQISLDNIL